MKVCYGPLCDGKEKSDVEFYKNKCQKDGLATQCRECSQHYRETHRKEARNYDKEYNKLLARRYSVCKRVANKKNLEFNLTIEQFDEITSQVCCYCGEYSENKNFCGIDRVDNNEGYTIKNCVPCCQLCNQMKSTLNLEIFLERIKKIFEVRFNG